MSKKRVQSLGYLNTGIFPATIMFSCGFDYSEIVKVLKKTKAKEWLAGIKGESELLNGNNWFGLKREIINTKTGKTVLLYYIILKNSFDFTDDSYCKLAHEVLHICQFMLPDLLDRDREFECEAYLHTHIMGQCLKQIRG